MRKTPPPQDFDIHVDPSCLSEGAEAETMSVERVPSNESSETVIHHDSWTKEELKDAAHTDEEEISADHTKIEEKDGSAPPAARKSVDSETSAANSVEGGEGNQLDVDTQSNVDTAEDDEAFEATERQIKRIEEEIRIAARQVVENLQHDEYEGQEDTILSTQTDEKYDHDPAESSFVGTEASAEDGERETSFISELDAPSDHHTDLDGGDSSSQHGDVDDDVFSSSDNSKRSSMNSMQSADDNQKRLTSPAVGEEAASAIEGGSISRISSGTSYLHHTPPAEMAHTPSKVLSRPPFRTPSSIRAMQMASPTASLFSSPRSAKRHLPTVSRLGTPNSHYSPTKRTPTRLKPRKPAPLVLLHITVMPLAWPYSYLMSASYVPESLQRIKESWRFLQDKVGETVMERGILLSHPQDSYDVLEERLYEALELPVLPRAKILKCGHYMGPLDAENFSTDEENDYFAESEIRDGRKWCDICGREVCIEEVGDLARGEKRFTIKVYASNGLMRAGAWDAVWKEMERVDVEIEPFVDTSLRAELEHLAAITHRQSTTAVEDAEDDFVSKEESEHVHEPVSDQEPLRITMGEQNDAMSRMTKEEETKERIFEEDVMRKRMADEEEMRKLMAEETELHSRMAEDDAIKRQMGEQANLRQNEERLRGMHAQEADRSPSPRRTSSKSNVHDDSSFVELLLAAFKVVLRDSKNVAIGVLSILVLLLALATKSSNHQQPLSPMLDNGPVSQITTATVIRELTVTAQAPTSALSQSIEVLSSIAESISASAVTTTVFREKTVTERIPITTSSEMSIDPCESLSAAPTQNVVPQVAKSMEEEVVSNASLLSDEVPSNEAAETQSFIEEDDLDQEKLASEIDLVLDTDTPENALPVTNSDVDTDFPTPENEL